jgi:hypothetical protein
MTDDDEKALDAMRDALAKRDESPTAAVMLAALDKLRAEHSVSLSMRSLPGAARRRPSGVCGRASTAPATCAATRA